MAISEAFSEILRGAERCHAGSSDFDLNPDQKPLPNSKLRPAAVLLAFEQRPEGLHLILTKRAAHLRHHPGQIALPGGKVDLDDKGFEAAALREAEEEIGLARDNVEIFGVLPTHETVTGFSVQPVLGRVRATFTPKPEAGEVEEIFTVPFTFLSQPENFAVVSRLWRGAPRYYYTAPYGPYYIWGATARILRGLADGMAK